MEFKTKAKEWGNSLGIIIPREIANKEHITANEEVIVEIKRKNALKEVFGSLKGWKINTQKLKDELRKEWQ